MKISKRQIRAMRKAKAQRLQRWNGVPIRIAEPAAPAASLGAPTVPRIENIHQKVYAAVSQPKALDMSSWHKCETTHCRAGWVTTLGGPEGKALEDFHNPELAAMLIYYASGYHINPARFYDSNADALADMKRLAEEESAAEAQS